MSWSGFSFWSVIWPLNQKKRNKAYSSIFIFYQCNMCTVWHFCELCIVLRDCTVWSWQFDEKKKPNKQQQKKKQQICKYFSKYTRWCSLWSFSVIFSKQIWLCRFLIAVYSFGKKIDLKNNQKVEIKIFKQRELAKWFCVRAQTW